MAKKSEIPFGAQFSPNQVDLPSILQIIHDNAGDREEITKVICDQFFADHSRTQNLKLADNVVLALRAYGLLDKDTATPTSLAKELLVLSQEPQKFYERFAKHILTDLKGVTLVETIATMQALGEDISLHILQKRLEQRGLHVPRGAVHLSSMRLWLALAGIFDKDVTSGPRLYEVNQARLKAVLGIELDEIDKLSQLTRAQRAFLRALTRIPDPDPLVANKVADLASILYAVEYNHKELPKSVLFPLRDAGYIQVSKSTKGRGAKPYEVFRASKFRQEISEPILAVAAEKAGLVPRELFERPLSRILDDLKSSNKHVKGKALELLAIYLTRLLDLDFKGWRIRSADTGGAEVDAIVEGARLIFSRWQIQAKNTRIVRLDDVAKEVGLSLSFVYSNVVTIVTTGEFTKDAYDYANHVMKTCNLNVILLNGSELGRIGQDPTDIVGILNSKAEHAMRVKERTDYFVAH
jgi:site-specific DNA-methyltransferase (cytosine-N4-specific)